MLTMSSRGEIFPESGMCRCGNYTPSRCACGEWWCADCLRPHTNAPGGRCPEADQRNESEGRHPENDADTFTTIENGVEGTLPHTRTQIERYSDKKAESMRAACWQNAWRVLEAEGYDEAGHLATRVKSAIMSVSPGDTNAP
jgi:hypothetical protein